MRLTVIVCAVQDCTNLVKSGFRICNVCRGEEE